MPTVNNALRLQLPDARASIAQLTEQAQRAVLMPMDPGGWSHSFRCAVAARIAVLHGEEGLAVQYRDLVTDSGDLDLAAPGSAARNAHERTILAFIDLMAMSPREVAAGDVDQLVEAGVKEADIVRLCELAAYLSYHCRVVAGLALMQEASA
ncbi:hypothetical protein RZ532_22600 [Nitratireductor aquimarinus]|uniref:hypothetical protein n=1 Tax=Nitratireductor aquimarinus TaxID=889300 RepID=UPI0029359AAF|nr:hypothetical protein [Nitratireductor aquimarinus]MDV2968781.1 hypothetical protein [Nitratireductor aquimarinus]